MIPLWVLCSLGANVTIIWIEWLNRSTDGLGAALWKTWPLIVVAQIGLHFAFNGPKHWFTAWMVFVVGSSLTRIGGVAMFAPEEVSSWTRTVAGIGVMLTGAYLVKGGLSE